MDDLDVIDPDNSVQVDWNKVWILSALHSTGHVKAQVRWSALREAMYRYAKLTGKPWNNDRVGHLDDVKRILVSWHANVDKLVDWARPLFS
jgi:hypothetical protein